jgi:hypothetical protein
MLASVVWRAGVMSKFRVIMEMSMRRSVMARLKQVSVKIRRDCAWAGSQVREVRVAVGGRSAHFIPGQLRPPSEKGWNAVCGTLSPATDCLEIHRASREKQESRRELTFCSGLTPSIHLSGL